MLCQFTVKNFRCFADEITLDMQAAPITEKEESVAIDTDGKKFLPLAVLYGPNGAGKSTVIWALSALWIKIIRPVSIAEGKNYSIDDTKQGIETFKFSDSHPHEPTEFEVFFRTSAYEYQYEISLKDEIVKTEQLSRKKINGKIYSKIFSRTESSVQLQSSLRNYKIANLSPKIPLLSYLAITYKQNPIVKDAFAWFENQLMVFPSVFSANESTAAKLMTFFLSSTDDSIRRRVLSMFKEMDIDVKNYRTEKEANQVKVFTTHIISSQPYELELEHESDGTIKLFWILPFIIGNLMHGSTLVIDELDSKLHPKLLQYIISLYNDPRKNPKRAQLIFTSHDVSTMNEENFRRDEIWFVAKGDNEASNLYSLVEIKNSDGTSIRKDAKYSKQYLEGRYGADPYLKKIIQWEDFHANMQQSNEVKES